MHGETIRVRVDLFPLQFATVESSGAVSDKSKARLFSESSFCVSVNGEFFDGRKERVEIRIASLTLFLALKGRVFSDRLKNKDAWDIYYCLQNYPGSLEALANEISPHLQNELIREGFQCIARLFSSVDDYGPKFATDFDEISDVDEREIMMRDVFERVHALLNFLGVK
jgi:predicted nucleotidyltransferase